jgi:hypothetical protein
MRSIDGPVRYGKATAMSPQRLYGLHWRVSPGEAMKRRSRAGGKASKARGREALKTKRRDAPKNGPLKLNGE